MWFKAGLYQVHKSQLAVCRYFEVTGHFSHGFSVLRKNYRPHIYANILSCGVSYHPTDSYSGIGCACLLTDPDAIACVAVCIKMDRIGRQQVNIPVDAAEKSKIGIQRRDILVSAVINFNSDLINAYSIVIFKQLADIEAKGSIAADMFTCQRSVHVNLGNLV